MAFARPRLAGQKSVAVSRDQRRHHGVVGIVGLYERMAGPGGPTGASRDLVQHLEAAFGGAQVAAVEPEIGVDHSDQGKVRKVVPLGDELGADDDIVIV